ncbi:MAG: hypothetical protein IKP06_00450 [Elusimicrobiaceae bacterium]|nr:hypothetical protein [Elusimicrobiaceae bacterium]
MVEIDLHCKIDEEVFSWVIFLVRLLVGGALLYVAAGSLLYSREFLYNATALGWPMPVPVGLSLLVVQTGLALLIILGWFTRLSCALSVICAAVSGIVFFAADLNKIYIALVLLLITSLLTPALLGPGKISLDYKHAVRRANKQFRG